MSKNKEKVQLQEESRKKVKTVRDPAAPGRSRRRKVGELTKPWKYTFIFFGLFGVVNGIFGLVKLGEAIYLLNFFLGLLFLLYVARAVYPKYQLLISRIIYLALAGAVVAALLVLRGTPIWSR